MSVCSTDRVEQPTALPILARASQRLWLFRTNDALAVHLCWAFHPACPSDHTDARSRGNLLAEISSSQRWREVVSAASDPTVTSRASADRLLRTEPQVRLTTRWSHRTITRTSSLSRTYLLFVRLHFVKVMRPAVLGWPKTIRRSVMQSGTNISRLLDGSASRVLVT